LNANAKASDTSLNFDFGAGGTVPYVPQVGDKVALPLLNREFDITGVTKTPTTASTGGTVTISEALGFTIDATTPGNVTTRYCDGAGLLAVLFTMVLTSFLVATIFTITTTHINMARRTADRAIALNYADGVIESLYDQWRQAMINVTTTADRDGGLKN